MDEILGSTMPKEESRLSECKNVEDKGDGSTPLASGETKDADDCGGRGSRCSSEKDSGFSDSSEWQQTDVEDQTNRSQSRECAGTPQAGQRQEQDQGDLMNPWLTPAGPKPRPVCKISNTPLKQPNTTQKRDQLLWRTRGRGAGGSNGTSVPPLQRPAATLRRSNTSVKKGGTFLPILNSYPHIAPRPGKKPLDQPPPSADSQNPSKRACRQPRTAATNGGLPSPAPSGQISSSSIGCQRNGVTGAHRHHRFLATMDALKRSGLLDIALRTRELLRQSAATGRAIARLRQHADLLHRAACGEAGAAWEGLCRAMAESGGYTPILSTVPGPSHNRPSEKVSFMSPDSSTG